MAKNRNRNPQSTGTTDPVTSENTMAEDTTQGGTGDDTTEVDTTQDQVSEETSQDTTATTVVGGEGADTVTGATGEDTVVGAAGTDTIEGATGTEAPSTTDILIKMETVVGGTGTDAVISTGETGTVTLTAADIAAPIVTTATIDESVAPAVLANATMMKAPIVETFGIMATLAFDNLAEYTNKMHHRKPIGEAEGAQCQIRLFLLLKSIVNDTTDEDFHAAFTKLLAWFHEHREGITHDHHMFRFAGEMQMTQTDRDAFYSLLTLFKMAADPAGRSVQLKQYSFRLGMERARAKGRGITEQGVQRIMSYFDVQ